MNILDYFNSQLSVWPAAAESYDDLKSVEVKKLDNGAVVQYNPARIVSTGAKVDQQSLGNRKCFLCAANRPLQQQTMPWGDYEILVNPFPIFPHHFTIPLKKHTDQRIYARVSDMCRLAASMQGYTVFYNGPECGASAPDHMHFQAVESDKLPIWSQIPDTEIDTVIPAEVFGSMGVVVLRAADADTMQSLFERVYRCLPHHDDEPMLNLLARASGDGTLTLVLVPRKKHRPSFYGDGDDQMVVSPASVDLAGVFIAPRRNDFDRFDSEVARQIYAELCMTLDEVRDICQRCYKSGAPVVHVGIMSEPKLEFVLHGDYLLDGEKVNGIVNVSARGFSGELLFTPVSDDAYVELKDVMIGVNFHWQRRENQCFKGAVKIIKDGDDLAFINVLPVEDYLESVISSEMSATSSLELLKAHAVISRSWLLAQINNKKVKKSPDHQLEEMAREHPDCIIKWYDHDDHDLFDVCADDHCQRYQGITRQTTPTVAEAVKATAGEVLMYGDELCDARFSKCCGGMMEQFEYCWSDEHKGYLLGIRDDAAEETTPDLRDEENARQWILSTPDAFCNTNDKRVLQQVLNGYDQETADFYRWQVKYDNDYLSDLILRRTGLDFGHIIDLVPVERGTSGRLSMLKIVGEKMTKTLGKELEIRRALSESHLYSSAFVVEHTDDDGFVLKGAGWGHGVGLCQIGAAMMADKGYDYKQILSHYYPGSSLKNVN